MSLCTVFLKQNPYCNIGIIQKCFLSSGAACCDKFSRSREAKFLIKVMGKTSKKRKSWQPEVFSAKNTMKDMLKPTVGKQHLQRLSMLNNLFMEYITGFLSASDVFKKVANYSLEINEVKVANDLNFINVYWSSVSDEDHVTIGAHLEEIAYPLRNELSKLNLIGSVPRIIFIRDVRDKHLHEIDRLLKIADYGEDFVPTNPTLFMDREFSKSVENQENFCTEGEEEGDAESRLLAKRQAEVEKLMALQKHSVFGLDQKALMNRIKASVFKSKALHREKIMPGEVVVEVDKKENPTAIAERIEALNSEDLKDFLSQRKRSYFRDKRAIERESNRAPEYRIFETESEERLQKEFEDDGSNYDYRDSSNEFR